LRRLRLATSVVLGVLPLLWMLPGRGQAGMPPPPPPLSPPAPLNPSIPPDPSPEELGRCVSSYGNTGCAARLYARLLCEVVGLSTTPQGLQQQLAGQFERASVDFRGIGVQQVETAALRYYVPMLCSARSRQIQELFAPLPEPAS